MSNLKINTFANIANRAWSTVANFIFVPLYIRFLGQEAYGLVTFFATFQVVLNLLGLGLSNTLRREFATHENDCSVILYKYKILRSVEFVYAIIGIVICAICFCNSKYISSRWLNVETLSLDDVSLTIRLMGVSIASQLIANLFLGCFFGLEKQIQANFYQITWSVIKNIGAVLIIIFITSSIKVFYLWHACIDILYVIVLRLSLHFTMKKKLGETPSKWSFKDLTNLKSIYKYALGIMLISLGYAINSQTDKLLISKSFSLVEVGAYNTVYSLSIVTTIITSALGIAAFPRFTNLFSKKDYDGLNNTFSAMHSISVVTASTLGAFLCVFSKEIITIWSGSTYITDIMQSASILMIIGTTLSVLQEIPYNYFLSRGVTSINNIQTVCQIIFVFTLTPFLIHKMGLLGASIAWFCEMLISTFIYLLVFYRKFFKDTYIKRLIANGIPLCLSLLLATTTRVIISSFGAKPIVIVAIAVLAGIIVLAIQLRVIHRFTFFK